MPKADEITQVTRQWVQKAENDLKNAAFTLKMGEACPTDTVCFHAQQRVEKYVKALLTYNKIDFARTHHIGTSISLLPENLRPDLTPEEQELLTDYVVSTRYPGDYEPISLGDARRAVKTARRVRNQVRKWLPSAATRPIKPPKQ